MLSITRIRAENFLSLRSVDVSLTSLTVLVGPNGAGKTNFLKIVQFLGLVARLDLAPAIDEFGGYDNIRYRGKAVTKTGSVKLEVHGQVTEFASPGALDEYSLSFWNRPIRHWVSNVSLLRRYEKFVFKRTKGPGRRINVNGSTIDIVDLSSGSKKSAKRQESSLSVDSSALSTLRRLGKAQGATQVDQMARLFETFRVFEVDVARAQQPSASVEAEVLASDASNLSPFLNYLRLRHEEVFDLLVDDLKYIYPNLECLEFRDLSGSKTAVEVRVKDVGIDESFPLSNASFGTVRGLAILAMLHDPKPPKLTCVEEIDHGLHPHALDRIVDRLRDAAQRTQLLIATHSPALVNRLEASELLVCERDIESGASRIPAVNPEEVAAMVQATELELGELWFSGALGGLD